MMEDVKYLSVVLEPLQRSALVGIFKRLHITEITKPNIPKTIVYDDDIRKYSEYITDVETFGFIIGELYNQGNCTRKEWWKIMLMARLFLDKFPQKEAQIHKVLFNLFVEDYTFYRY